MKKIYLVDVSNMFFRAFYAIPRLTNAKGMPTNALYGFVGMTAKLLRENRPDYMAYCFDRPEPSFRAELYEDYKANRSEMPDDLEPQLPYIRRITEVLGIPILDKIGFEADDIIGTLACEAAAKGIEAVIVSGDKDFAQLVNHKVSLYDTMKNVRYDGEAVRAKWGISPEQMVDYLSIVGDTSDNVPGIRGIGPKGACKLLEEFGSLEGIYQNLEKISAAGLKKKLIEGEKAALLAKTLVKIKTDVALEYHVEDLKLAPIARDQMKDLFEELEFGSLTQKLLGSGSGAGESRSAPQKTEEPALSVTTTMPELVNWPRMQWELAELVEKVKPQSEIWAIRNERGFCFGYDQKFVQVNAELEKIGEALANHKLRWKGFNVKDLWWEISLPQSQSVDWDTMLAAYVIKPRAIESFNDVYKTVHQQELPDLLSPEEVLAFELQLHNELRNTLKTNAAEKVYDEIERPLVPVLYAIERHGLHINREELRRQSLELTHDIQALEAKIHHLAGERFNVASPKQLGHILFEKLGVPVGRKTKTGYSTDSDVLSKMAKEFPICGFIIEFRELSKLKSTYVDALPVLVAPHDDRLHTRFQQAVTTTGRLSSVNPNLQNIPIRTERGRLIRRAFVSDKDHLLLSADYSQIELRVLAEITGDPGLCQAFERDLDIHAATAAEIFNIKLGDVTANHRRMAKAVNFGLAYGQSIFGLAETLDITRDEAKTIIDSYFTKFKGVKDFMVSTVEKAKERGYVETLFGRRRYLDELKASNQMVRKFGERAAINAPIQGTASDIMKIAMIEVAKKVKCPMVLQVHDELMFECSKEAVEKEAATAKKVMESVGSFKIPLKANVAWGENWEDAHS